jgi:hypothetical protein
MQLDHVANRDQLVRAIREEFIGPAPYGPAIDVGSGLTIATIQESYGPYRTSDGEEILCWENPVTRYGVGVLFPVAAASNAGEAEVPTTEEDTQDHEAESLGSAPDLLVDDKARESLAKLADKSGGSLDEDSTELDLSSANARRPSSLGVSFLVDLPRQSGIHVKASGGRYTAIKVKVPQKTQERRWFVRKPWSLSGRFSAEEILANRRGKVILSDFRAEGLDDLSVTVEAFARAHGDRRSLVTITLVNRTEEASSNDERCLFQCRLEAQVVLDEAILPAVLPYPGPHFSLLDEEEQSLSLLYRRWQTFAIGHGCSADWVAEPGAERATAVVAEILPTLETPSITPDILDESGASLSVPMAPLAGLIPNDDGRKQLDHLLSSYKRWIESKEQDLSALPTHLRPVGQRHLALCRDALARMRSGLELIDRDENVRLAFQLANRAVLLQQLHSERQPRLITGRRPGGGYSFSREAMDVDPALPTGERGRWRPFQIAFLLMALDSTANANSPDRELIELIWFPTGGGKTEAYLGLTAFALLVRRLRDPTDDGVHVITRYTLRLLTTQQFQRAMSLVCAMERIRLEHRDQLGSSPFTIGVWLGRATTPNTRASALHSLGDLQKDDKADNPFLVTRCPWCAAQIGPITSSKKQSGLPRIAGYAQHGNTVQIACPDSACAFNGGLPVWVVDEDIYDHRPSVLIGTVDKFASISWIPRARALFGLDEKGNRVTSPPGLVIQDELHLISGPLGSMVGLYELAINELCTDRRDGVRAPKIVTSTATIRRYEDQLRGLYARNRATLFPPPGLEVDDSFFSRYARHDDGTLARGRLYVGVHATNHGSLITTQVQAMSALLQAPVPLGVDARDPWWTLLVFFNTLRDLGTSLSLLQSNVPMHLKAIANRQDIASADLRRFYEPLELTSRIRNDDVPKAIASLEVTAGSVNPRPIDVCLASNIIEVGIDIDRLSQMVVVGQPKTTAQYIQVTGRIGRRWWERPGLVTTLLNASRPRDRSHYEKFRSYHERLYAQVEPTSVTPFSPPAVERALHAVLAAIVRQTGDAATVERPVDVPMTALEEFRRLVLERVAIVDPSELPAVTTVLNRRFDELRRWGRMRWGRFGETDEDGVMLTVPDSEIEGALTLYSWPTPLSMRNVDAECELEVTMRYAAEPTSHH